MGEIKALWHRMKIGSIPFIWFTLEYYPITRTFTIPWLYVGWQNTYTMGWGPFQCTVQGHSYLYWGWRTVTRTLLMPYIARHVKWIPFYIWVPDVKIVYKSQRVISSVRERLGVAALALGVVGLMVSGVGEVAGALGVAGCVIGGTTTGLGMISGEVQAAFTDPALDINVEGFHYSPV